MTKAELVNKVAATIQLPTHQTETVVNLFLQCITDALRAGDKVELRGFGSFRLRRRKARAGRNPKTGDPVPIPAKQVPWFTAGKALRARWSTTPQPSLPDPARRLPQARVAVSAVPDRGRLLHLYAALHPDRVPSPGAALRVE